MLGFLLASALFPLAGPRPAPPPVPVVAQDDEETPDKRPEIKEQLKRLDGHAGKRGKEDHEAIGIIDQLILEFPQSGPKDRAAIVKGIGKCLGERRKQTEEGMLDNRLHLAAALALGEMGPESAKTLMDWIDHKTLRDDLQLQRQLILSLGKTHTDDAQKPLVDLLTHHEAIMQGAAAEALANYKDEDGDVRKDLFEEILKVLTAAKNLVDADVTLSNPIARERYDVIAAPMITTLQTLSRHDERDPSEWQHWWNKNKKADWDEES